MGRSLIDWSVFEVRADSGTLMIHSTINGALADLDQWAFYERTGVDMAVGRSKWMVGWKSILKSLNMLSESGELHVDRKKLIKSLEEDLTGWEKEYESKKHQGASFAALSETELKSVTTTLHQIFMKRKQDDNKLEIGVLAGFAAGIEGDPEEWKSNIRSAAKMLPSVFSVGAGAAPSVVRLVDSKGKPTGKVPFDTTRKPKGTSSAADSETYQRWSNKVEALGFKSQKEFKQALKDLGTKTPTGSQLKAWLKGAESSEDEEDEGNEPTVELEEDGQ